jgi:hypothetical protein
MYFVMDYDNRGGPPLNVRQGGYIHKETALKKAKTMRAAVIINERREALYAVKNGRLIIGE